MNRRKRALVGLVTFLLAACGGSTGSPSRLPTTAPATVGPTTAAPSTAASDGQQAGGGSIPEPTATPVTTVEPGSPFGRHDTAPGSVATFLEFTTGGGGYCDDAPEPGPPSVHLSVMPLIVCGSNFVSGQTVGLTLRGPGEWERKSQFAVDESGLVMWQLDELPSPIHGEYVIEAIQGQADVRSTASVKTDELAAVLLPFGGVRIGETAHLFVTGGPRGGTVSAYLYGPVSDDVTVSDQIAFQFAAVIGPVHLDENGEGRIALTPRRGDPSGQYLLAIPGTLSQEFAVIEPGSHFDPLSYIDAGVRQDLSRCAERTENLPMAAEAGVECRVGSGKVDSVGFYLFRNPEDMLKVYFARIKANGVTRNTGDCRDGKPGDTALTTTGDERVGCYVNDQGFANVRWTLSSGPIYIGVLGNDDDIASLVDWSTGGGLRTDLWTP